MREDAYREAIRAKGVQVDANVRGFELGLTLARGQASPTVGLNGSGAHVAPPALADDPRVTALPERLRPIVRRPHLIKEPTAKAAPAAGHRCGPSLARRACSRTAFGLASTTRRTCGSMIRAIATELAVASIATSSSGPSDPASSASACGSLATRPAVLTLPPSALAT